MASLMCVTTCFLPWSQTDPAVQVTQQAQTGELGPDAVVEGGDTDTERRSNFLELSLALAGGLDAAGLETLYKAAKPGIQASHLVTASQSSAWSATCVVLV